MKEARTQAVAALRAAILEVGDPIAAALLDMIVASFEADIAGERDRPCDGLSLTIDPARFNHLLSVPPSSVAAGTSGDRRVSPLTGRDLVVAMRANPEAFFGNADEIEAKLDEEDRRAEAGAPAAVDPDDNVPFTPEEGRRFETDEEIDRARKVEAIETVYGVPPAEVSVPATPPPVEAAVVEAPIRALETVEDVLGGRKPLDEVDAVGLIREYAVDGKGIPWIARTWGGHWTVQAIKAHLDRNSALVQEIAAGDTKEARGRTLESLRRKVVR